MSKNAYSPADMTIKELKSAVEVYRKGAKGKSGTIVSFSETGPVGLSLIDSIVEVLESQEKRIAELESNQGKCGP